MIVNEQYSVEIKNTDSISSCLIKTRFLCEHLGFDNLSRNLVYTSVSEILTNVIKYAENGFFKIFILKNRRGIRIEVKDKGPGIKDISKAQIDGFSTLTSSLGLGLGIAKRGVDFFSIESIMGEGTSVIMEKWLPIPKTIVNYSAISVPDINYIENGDGYLFKEYNGDSLFVAIVDGLGEGKNAYKTSKGLLAFFEENYYLPLLDLLKQGDVFLRNNFKDSGATVGLLKITPEVVSYAGVGDTFINVYTSGCKKKSLHSKEGILGAFKMPKVKVQTFNNAQDYTFIICTDGIKDSFTLNDLSLSDSTRLIARQVHNTYKRSYGDATVLVIKTKY